MTNLKKTKKAEFQKLPLERGSSFVIKRYESPNFETPWHFHEEYELVYCEKGFGKKIIGDSFSNYQEGDLGLLGKNVPHLFKADDSFYQVGSAIKPSSIVLQFNEDFLGKDFFNCPEMANMKRILSLSMNGLLILGDTKLKIKNLMTEMLDLGNIYRLNKLMEIFALLAESQEMQPIALNIISGVNSSDSFKMNKVLEYTLQHYKQEISIENVAQICNLSESAFCRYFKARTQKSYLSFVIEMRLNDCCRLLRDTDKSILEICYACGFNNLSNFNRLFRKQYNLNPKEYRKNGSL